MTDRVARAVTAAVAVARAHGLACADPAVLHDGVNVVVHLRPAPVVARVATLTPLLRPGIGGPFGRELALATALGGVGAAVVPPSELLPPGPHERDGLTLSFWRHLRVLPDRPTPARVGAALGELHAALAGLPPLWAGSPLDTPLADLAVFVARGRELGADPSLLERTAELVARLQPLLAGPETTLHGDTHPGNLLRTPAGWVWADLEDTSRGPLGWDLACLRRTGRLDGRAALDALPGAPTDAELAPFSWLRALHAAAWWHVHAVRVPGDLAAARDQLRTAVEEVGAGLEAAGAG